MRRGNLLWLLSRGCPLVVAQTGGVMPPVFVSDFCTLIRRKKIALLRCLALRGPHRDREALPTSIKILVRFVLRGEALFMVLL